MPPETRKFNDSSNDDSVIASTLGTLQKCVDNGSIKNMTHSYYAGHELYASGVPREEGVTYRKYDLPSTGSSGSARGKHRVVVAVKDDQLVEGAAYIWYHKEYKQNKSGSNRSIENNIKKLDAGFDAKAKTIRNYKP